MPEISIIIPVYKIEKYISACLDSVLSQTFCDIEVIVVDDGSPDTCPSICDTYAKKDSRIKVIHKENGGLSSARNAGIDAACGNYIMTVDGDDYIDKNMCRRLYDTAKSTGADMVVCSINNVEESGDVISGMNSDSPLVCGVMSKDDYKRALLKKGNWYYAVAWNKLYKKELFNSVRYPVGKIHEDEHIIHHLVENCDTIACIEDRLYYYVNHAASITHRAYSVKRLEILTAFFDRSLFYMETSTNGDIVVASVIGAIKTLYASYLKADMKNKEFKVRYRELHSELKSVIRKALSFKMSVAKRAFLCVNMLAPYLTGRIITLFKKF